MNMFVVTFSLSAHPTKLGKTCVSHKKQKRHASRHMRCLCVSSVWSCGAVSPLSVPAAMRASVLCLSGSACRAHKLGWRRGEHWHRAGGRAGPVLSPVVWCALKSTARALNGQPSECGRCACAVRRAEAFSGQSARRGRPRWYEPSRAGVPSVNLAVNHLSTRQLPQCLTSNFFRPKILLVIPKRGLHTALYAGAKILFIRPVPCPK